MGFFFLIQRVKKLKFRESHASSRQSRKQLIQEEIELHQKRLRELKKKFDEETSDFTSDESEHASRDEDDSKNVKRLYTKKWLDGRDHTPKKSSTLSNECDSELAKFLKQQAAVELPSFDGEYLNWLYFYNAYQESKNLFSSVQNKNRIMKAIVNKNVKDKVASLLANPETVEEAIKLLHEDYGDPTMVLKACVNSKHQSRRKPIRKKT